MLQSVGHKACTLCTVTILPSLLCQCQSSCQQAWNAKLALQVKDFRKLVDGKIGDKHEELMSRMGAIMAGGILDAGESALADCWYVMSCILHTC